MNFVGLGIDAHVHLYYKDYAQLSSENRYYIFLLDSWHFVRPSLPLNCLR